MNSTVFFQILLVPLHDRSGNIADKRASRILGRKLDDQRDHRWIYEIGCRFSFQPLNSQRYQNFGTGSRRKVSIFRTRVTPQGRQTLLVFEITNFTVENAYSLAWVCGSAVAGKIG